MTNCSVSVIIPTRDRAPLLPLALESVQRQSWADWECLVIDDHSQDGTNALVEAFQQKDSRFRYHALPPEIQGANAARNRGVSLSSGRYLIFLDSDDALHPECLARRVAAMDADPELDFAVGMTRLFHTVPGDRDILWNIFTDESDLHRFLTLDIPWQTAGVIWRKNATIKLGPWDETLLSWQDWEYHLRALAVGLRFIKLGDVDSYWRMPRGDSLWELSSSPLHLRQRTCLFLQVEKRLRPKWTPEIQRRLAGLYFWQARLWCLRQKNRRQAIVLWFRARWRGLVPTRHFLSGCVLLLKKPSTWAAQFEKLSGKWPPEYFETGNSRTFQQVSEPPALP